MTAMTILPTQSAQMPRKALKSADEYRRELMIDYAFEAYQYVITAAEADEIIFEGLWEGVDDFVQYMWDANVGQAVPGTSNVRHDMKVYTSEELDRMDAGEYYDSDDSEEEYEYEYVYEVDVDTAEEVYLEELMGLSADESFDEDDVASIAPTVITEPEDFHGEDDDEPLPLYSNDCPPSYPNSPALSAPPAYAEEADEVAEVEVEVEVEVEPAAEQPAPPAESEEEPVAVAVVAQSAAPAKAGGVFAGLGARLDRGVLKAKRGLRALIASRRGRFLLRTTRRFSSSSS